MNIKRKGWDEYFMDLARLVATRSTCDRAHVGCVIVKDKHVISTGYNGALSGQPECDQFGHIMIDNHCLRSVHGETSSISQAAKHGNSVDGATAYCTHFPCITCFKLLVASGIKKIVYGQEYRTEDFPKEILNTVELVFLNSREKNDGKS